LVVVTAMTGRRPCELRRRDPSAARVAAEELVTVERIRARLSRPGWWN